MNNSVSMYVRLESNNRAILGQQNRGAYLVSPLNHILFSNWPWLLG